MLVTPPLAQNLMTFTPWVDLKAHCFEAFRLAVAEMEWEFKVKRIN